MQNKIDNCCADCGYLTKRNYCMRYEIFMLGVNVRLCTCESFTLESELDNDVSLQLQTNNHSRE